METKSIHGNAMSFVAVLALAGATAAYYITLKAENACVRLEEAKTDYQVQKIKAQADYFDHQVDMMLAVNVAPEIRGQHKTDMRLAYLAISTVNKGALSAIQHRIDRLTAETSSYPCR